jgi:hypothetical protein
MLKITKFNILLPNILLAGICMIGLPSFLSQLVFAQNGGDWSEYSREVVANASIYLPPDNFQYFSFYAAAPVNVLTGSYEELSTRELMVTVYDASTCNVPVGSFGFDITTCTTIDANLYNEIQSAGRPTINLYPGQYFLKVEAASYEDVAVNIYFELVGYTRANGGDINIEDEEGIDEEEGNDQGGCLQGPGGCGGAFDIHGFGPYSPLNPNFGQPYNPLNPYGQ